VQKVNIHFKQLISYRGG